MKKNRIVSLAVLTVALTLAVQPAHARGASRAIYPRESGYSTLTPNDLTREVQVALEEKGYSVENTDGRYTAETRAVVARFQRDNNLRETGTITRGVLRKLHLS